MVRFEIEHCIYVNETALFFGKNQSTSMVDISRVYF